MRRGGLPAALTLVGLALLCPTLGVTQELAPNEGSHPGDPLRVYLVTMGQGDPVWEKFSHNAIWIQNEEAGWGRAYNWGIFDFNQADFIPRLIRGTMLYMMAPFDPGASLANLEQTDRAVWLQELDLTPAQKAELLSFLEWNALPENRDYRYDYYRDNCSTRVRDALDAVLGGRLRASAEADTTAYTYRWHTRRLLQGRPAEYVGIQLVLNSDADRPLTGWEELFLPIKLMERIRDVQVPDGQGGMKPLVVMDDQFLETTRPPIPTRAPFALPWFLLVGIAWGGGILLLSRRGEALGLVGCLGLATLAGSWSLVATVCGTLLLGAWAFTDHAFWYRNLNLLQLNPLFLLLLIAYLIFLFKGIFPRWGRTTALVLALLAGVGLLIRLIPGLGQMNGEILALTLPVNLSLALGTNMLAGEPAAREAGGEPR